MTGCHHPVTLIHHPSDRSRSQAIMDSESDQHGWNGLFSSVTDGALKIRQVIDEPHGGSRRLQRFGPGGLRLGFPGLG